MRNKTLLITVLLLSTSYARAQSMDGIGSVFESKQEKYERERQENQREYEQKQKLQQSIQTQQQEMRRLEEERRRLLSGNTQQPIKPNSSRIQLYVVSRCAPCLKTIGYLDALNVEYDILEVDRSISIEQLYLQRFGRGAMPVIDSPNGVSRGYDPKILANLLATAKQKLKTRPKLEAETSTPHPDNTKKAKSDFDVSPTLNQQQ